MTEYSVTIDKPGYGAVRLGPYTYEHTAQSAAESLRWSIISTQHPEGTTVAVTPHDPALAHEYPGVPTEPGTLAELVAQEPPHDGTGSNFPDLYTRLAAWAGHDTASRLWRQACQLADGRCGRCADRAEQEDHVRTQEPT